MSVEAYKAVEHTTDTAEAISKKIISSLILYIRTSYMYPCKRTENLLQASTLCVGCLSALSANNDTQESFLLFNLFSHIDDAIHRQLKREHHTTNELERLLEALECLL